MPLLIADKLFDSYNAEMVSGTHYSDFMKGQYAVRLETRSSKPTLLMSNYSDLWFETIVSSASAQTSDGSYQPLGELGGRGQGKLNGDRVSFVADEPGYIMSIVSIIPRVDYYQGVKPLLYDLNFSDFYNPNFDNIGFQSLPLSQVWGYPAAFSTGSDSTDYTFNSTSASNYFGISGSFSCINEAPLSNAHSLAIGYQPAWTDYMSNVSTIHGDFVDTLRYWTLGRNFMSSSTDSGQTYYTANTSAYIDPSLYNFAFADTANYADNFFTQIAFNLKFNSPISKRVMPHL